MCDQTLAILHITEYNRPSPLQVNTDYVGNWGGIMFANAHYEHGSGILSSSDQPKSRITYTEIVGGGYAHNDSSSALTMIYR